MASTATFSSVELLDRWRKDMGLDHAAFAAFLGRHKSEWSRVWRGDRAPSQSLIRTALGLAQEPWKSALEKALIADLGRAVA
jgi:hypothetical protein